MINAATLAPNAPGGGGAEQSPVLSVLGVHEVTVPENCKEGEIMPFMLPDGGCETTRVPDGMKAGDDFPVVTSSVSCAGSSVEGCTPCPVDSLDGKIKASCHSHAELPIGDAIPRPIERDVLRTNTCEKIDLSGETMEASDPY